MDYVFTLKYQLAAQDNDIDSIVERLGEAGCDDALVGIGLPGRVALAFTRDAQTAQHAVLSALADAHRALPAAILIEVAPDLVGLTDVAEQLGVSRQNMRKLMLSHPGTFPLPVHDGSTALWHLADVLAWMQSRGRHAQLDGVLDVARVALQINVAREARRLTGGETQQRVAW